MKRRSPVCIAVSQFIVGLFSVSLCAASAQAAEAPTIQLGLVNMCTAEADHRNVEFQLYDRMVPVYRENGIRAGLLDYNFFYQQDCSEDALLAMLKQFHVVELRPSGEESLHFDAKRAAIVGRALARYVKEGGGLFLQPQPVRYIGDDDEAYWNAVIAPFDAKVLHEGVFDKTRTFEALEMIRPGKATFWHTGNIQPHPVTKGVSSLYLPLINWTLRPGVAAMQYGPEWQVIVRGEKEAKSYREIANQEYELDVKAEGSCAEAPPVLAVRQFGKGRIVCYPLSFLYLGPNHRNPLWPETVEVNGDRAAGRPSHSMKMQMNAYRWLAETALPVAGLGTYKPQPYQPIQFPKAVSWDQEQFPLPTTVGIRGIFGAHTSLSDGAGGVADYVKAAKAAGLSFIVFNDSLEKLTPETLAKLKADCAAASKAGDFYACPGIEVSDGIGNRWALWGEKVVFPDKSFHENGFTYSLWDGKCVRWFGNFMCKCSFGGSALLDYRQLRQKGAHPEHFYDFYDYLPFVYDKDRPIADNMSEYLFGLRDLRNVTVASFTRVRSPTEVAAAAAACSTGIKDVATVKSMLNTRGCNGWGTLSPERYVSQGPVIAQWQAVNSIMEKNWACTRGAQRVRLRFAVRSEAGIAEVKILDADHGPIRRFLGHGTKELSREFELVHDQQHYLVLEVTDTAGRKAISGAYYLFCYKNGLFRCGDNTNILCSNGLIWNPDSFFPGDNFFFYNADDYRLFGGDGCSPTAGLPVANTGLCDSVVRIKEAKGEYPSYAQLNKLGAGIEYLMDVGVNSSNMQIAAMHMNKLVEFCRGDDKRPSSYHTTVGRDVGDLEYFEQTHTLYIPKDRVDWFVTWDYRRLHEGRKDYKGGIVWHEGEFRFKKDCTLQGAVPIPLLQALAATDVSKMAGTAFVVSDTERNVRIALVHEENKLLNLEGRIRPGGYAALMTTPVGYHALLVPADMNFGYVANLVAPQSPNIQFSSLFQAGIGRDGQKIKAGTVLKYRFGVGNFVDPVAGNDLLEHTVKAMNLGGGHAGYPVEMKVGELEDAVFFFTARAKGHEAAFKLGPQDLVIDLPIRVRGLENNGCAAVYSAKRPWLRFVPVDAEGTAWLQESIDQANEMWVGNVFACDNKDVKITLVVDGQSEGKPPFVELHNPTDKEIAATLRSPAHAPMFGGLTASAKIPAGDGLRFTIEGKALKPWAANRPSAN